MQFEGFNQGLNIELGNGSTQEVAPNSSINFDFRFGAPVEGVSFQPVGDQPYSITGTTAANTFGVVPLDIAFREPGTEPIVTIGDGLGGNDRLERDTTPLPTVDPFFVEDAAFPGSFADPDDYITYIYDNAPGSGDVIDLGPNARVTAAFADAFRAVDVDLDLQAVDQAVDVNGNTIRFEGPIRNFVGSAFDDTLRIDAIIGRRSAVGGDGTDAITIDVAGRPVTQTVDSGTTTVEVAGYSPIDVTEFETITIDNAGPAGDLAFDLSPGADALLQLEAMLRDDTTTLGLFALSEANAAFAEEAFLHEGGVTEIRSVGGTDTLTIDVIGQPVEVVGSDVLIGDLPAIRLVGFTEVTIDNVPVPGDYNNDRKVDLVDYTVWRDNLGANAGTLPNDSSGGVIGSDQYNTWRANFGRTPGSEVFQLTAPSTIVNTETIVNTDSEAAAARSAIDAALASLAEPNVSTPTGESLPGAKSATRSDLLLLLLPPAHRESDDTAEIPFLKQDEESSDSSRDLRPSIRRVAARGSAFG